MLYASLVFFHILLFVFWLGGDLGVAILGDHFRKRNYSISERKLILKLLVINDLGPRIAWALMVASSISLLHIGGYWVLPISFVGLSWIVSLAWVVLILSIHQAGQTEKASKLKQAEFALKWALSGFYLVLGSVSILTGEPLAPQWLAVKALLFGFIFVAAILIDLMFKPVGPALQALVAEGASEETEVHLLAVMNRSRFWVRVTYLLLVIVGFLGSSKLI